MNTFFPYNPRLKKLARKLRQNMTLGEVLLWQKIRGRKLGYQFHRQIPIGEYIVDFYCHELFLAIEVDGSSHEHPDVAVSDLERQCELESLGISFLRFEEKEIRDNVDIVVEIIEQWIEINKISPRGEIV
jgi:very-short-patch-repair endonuclease